MTAFQINLIAITTFFPRHNNSSKQRKKNTPSTFFWVKKSNKVCLNIVYQYGNNNKFNKKLSFRFYSFANISILLLCQFTILLCTTFTISTETIFFYPFVSHFNRYFSCFLLGLCI